MLSCRQILSSIFPRFHVPILYSFPKLVKHEKKPVTVTPMARSDLRSVVSRPCQFQLSLSLSLSRPCQFQLSFSLSLSRPCQFKLSFSLSLSLSRPCQFQLSISILGQGSRLLTYTSKMKVFL